ncbi:MAG: hypothetical protein ABR867_05525 [Nitrososphaerales archaeon]|jgi:hypothetical protein
MPTSQPVEIDGENSPFRDALLDKLVGKWRVKGRIAGQAIMHACDAEWVLNHQFLRVHFVDVSAIENRRARSKPRKPDYEAEVFIGYDNMSERYVVHWLDTFGGRFSESLGYGRRDGANAVRFVFEYPDGPLHNTFSWKTNDKTWSIMIEQKDGRGKWTVFAEEVLERSS